MLIALIVVLALSCLFCGVRFIKAMDADEQEKATVLKGLTTICCIIIALIAYFTTALPEFAVLVILGLIFGFLGDELLALRFVYTKKFNAFFLSGALAFLIGHIFYLAALYGLAPGAWKLALPLTLAALAAELINTKKHSLDMGKLFLPLGFYASFVCFMGCSAVAVCIFHFSFGTLLFALAGLCFVISDSILSVQCFSDHPSDAKNRVLHVFYWAAQLLIALSPLFIK